MHLTTALRWAAIYRAVSWAFGLVFFGFVYLGFRLSLGGLPLSLGAAIEAAASPLFIAPVLVGFLLWQTVTTVAYYATVSGAVEETMADQFDAQMVKSEILEVLDDRLAEMESQMRRSGGTSRATGGGSVGGGPTGGGSVSGGTTGGGTTGGGATDDTGDFDFDG